MAPNKTTVLQKIEQVIVSPFAHLDQVIAAINTALKAEPQVKAAITGLLAEIQSEGAMVTAAATVDGLNVPADMAAATGAAALFTYIKSTFIPAIEAAYEAEKTAIQTGQTQPVSTAAAPAAPAETAAVD